MNAKRVALILLVISAIGICISCSQSVSTGVGTPAFYWQSSRKFYLAGDYLTAMQNLDSLVATDNEYIPRALPWDLVLKSGIADGYMYAAENYATGAHQSRNDPTSFRRQVTGYRTSANQLALQFVEDFSKLDKLTGDTVALEFVFPPGTAAPVMQFNKVTSGIALTPAEFDTAQRRALERGVVLAVCRAAGAPDDPAKAEELLKPGSAKVPRATFLYAMADTLYRFSQLYGADKLDEPVKMEALIQRAQKALASVPDSKETKELKSQMESALKKNQKNAKK